VKQPPLTAGGFAAFTGAEPRAVERLAAYLELLDRWQRRLNLVGRSTLADPWRRHVLDSAQLAPLLPPGTPAVVDFGSGAGFPGLVLALMSKARVTLVDADGRKCAFLAAAIRETGAEAMVLNRRLESLDSEIAEIVTARACAPLPALLAPTARVLRPGGFALFLKGRALEGELTAAAKNWKMHAVRIASASDPSGVVLKVEGLSRR
jgi:16S rRNA (guanine527-N7)-methyltransferase